MTPHGAPWRILQSAIVELLTKGLEKGGATSSGAPRSAELQLSGTKPAVVLVVGVNGAGKVGSLRLFVMLVGLRPVRHR